MMGKAKQEENGITGSRQNSVKRLDVTQLQPSNDANQYGPRRKESARKIFTIAIMFVMIAYIVWTMG